MKPGDRVKVGQVLALLDISGNSDAPRLHFQLTDANAPMAAEGIPCELAIFTQLGVLDNPEAVDDGQAWRQTTQTAPIVRRSDFPVNNAVVTFP